MSTDSHWYIIYCFMPHIWFHCLAHINTIIYTLKLHGIIYLLLIPGCKAQKSVLSHTAVRLYEHFYKDILKMQYLNIWKQIEEKLSQAHSRGGGRSSDPHPTPKWPSPMGSQDNPRVIIKGPKIWQYLNPPPPPHTHTHTHKSLATGLYISYD